MTINIENTPFEAVLRNKELNDLYVAGLRFYMETNTVEADFRYEKVLPYEIYRYLIDQIESLTGSRAVIRIIAGNGSPSTTELRRYADSYIEKNYSCSVLSDGVFRFDSDEDILTYLFYQAEDAAAAAEACMELGAYLKSCGIGVSVNADVLVQPEKEVQNIPVSAVYEAPQEPAKPLREKKAWKHIKPEDYTVIELHDVTDPIQDIRFKGDVFACDMTERRKTNRMIQTISVYDGTDAIIVKRFEGRGLTREEMAQVKNGSYIEVYGKIEYDSFSHDLVCMASEIEVLEKPFVKDEEENKRIEFHTHTNMSEMDGVCDISEIVSYAWKIGHEGIVITDHADVQSFVKAYNNAQALKKTDPERSFKVGLGCELNMVNDELTIVRNVTDDVLDDLTYIVFDLETTGLSCYFDHMIEFGAVKMKNQTIIDRKQLFIKPPVPIPAYITAKTNITNDMVRNALPFKDAADDILEWISDGVLVAHNASFDYYFMNEELRRIGREPLMNTVIDTLDMARAVLKDRKAYRLGNIARNYRIAYDEEVAHRADYDAETLSGVFLSLMRDASAQFSIRTVRDLQEKLQDDKSFVKQRRMHAVALAKDREGIRSLYRLVTDSHTKTLAVMGKAKSKEGTDTAAEARVLRSDLVSHRSHLLIGSSCLNGEVFELACNGDDERLLEAMRFYDYIEIQPPANYTTSIALGNLPSMDRLKEVLKRIIRMADQAGIPVIADSDAHYCTKDEKIFRDVYIMNQGVGGVTHPLYIRDETLRLRTKNPDQHIRLTKEMKEEFAWLNDEALIERIVVEEPKRLFALLEEVRPVPSGTFPPHIEGSDDKLRDICHTTARNMYEFEGKVPAIVSERLDGELDNIIRNGFGVHYYIAHLLVRKSNDDGYVVGSRGSVGSSFTATMAGITEVNPLKPHYLCPKCHYSEWIEDINIKSGFDLPDKTCPHCGTIMRGNGHNIPFQTFLGFNADKTPDIDLNFSNEYQWRAHAFIREVFGEDHAFRAGTIGTVAEKTAFGYVTGYCEKMHIEDMRKPMHDYLASKCQNVKKTSGQHPGGIIIIPEEYCAEDFTPVQYPANDPEADWKTTHYDFHDIHDNVLKFDILGHVDPTAMRMLQNIADVKPMDIPMNDPETLSLFYSDDALRADPRIYRKETGALGLPEFGTRTTRGVLEETRPKKFSDLVIISGLSHGTDVWSGNAQELIRSGHTIDEVIGCRDDIMTYLLDKQLEPIDAFRIMEDVRKGKGLREDQEEKMKNHHVPDWYIDSCKKIKYMFPKAHAVAYVMMAMRIAWYKVHEPRNFYIQFLSLRCDAYEIETMTKGIEAVRERMQDISSRMNDRNAAVPVTNKEKSLFDTLEVCEELYARGYRIGNVDLYRSKASEFTAAEEDDHLIIPPFTVIDGLGDAAARSVEEARNRAEFLSKEDMLRRTQLTGTHIKKLDAMGCLKGMQERNQMSLF